MLQDLALYGFRGEVSKHRSIFLAIIELFGVYGPVEYVQTQVQESQGTHCTKPPFIFLSMKITCFLNIAQIFALPESHAIHQSDWLYADHQTFGASGWFGQKCH